MPFTFYVVEYLLLKTLLYANGTNSKQTKRNWNINTVW